jgi:Integrase core domain
MLQLPSWITHYNEMHPHKALGYRSPREFIAARGKSLTVSDRSGATTDRANVTCSKVPRR